MKLLRRIVNRLKRGAPPALLVHPVEPLTRLRCGIVGFGAMGRTHAEVLGSHPYFEFSGFTSRIRPAEPQKARWYDCAEEMIRSGDIDVLVVATPHWVHADYTLMGLRAGLHVVCEKPLTVTSHQADEVLRTASASKGKLACVFQSRFEPVLQRVKAILDRGELGSVIRCEMEESFWRSEAYYSSNAWRGSWQGEGGGVLINQGPHLLDRYAWLCGMPESVSAFCDTTLHGIEVEDCASAIFRHAGGWHGHLHVNTTECPQTSRLMVSCDGGRITVERGCLRVERLDASIRERTKTTAEAFANIESTVEESDGAFLDAPPVLLSRFYENVALSIAGKHSLAITSVDAAQSVELANAIQISAATKAPVSLPSDRVAGNAFFASRLNPPVS